jgi:predicted RNase H-like nuclease (RuvC/YqgF family)
MSKEFLSSNSNEQLKEEIELLTKRLQELEKQYNEVLPRKGLSEQDDNLITSLENEINTLKANIEELENKL